MFHFTKWKATFVGTREKSPWSFDEPWSSSNRFCVRSRSVLYDSFCLKEERKLNIFFNNEKDKFLRWHDEFVPRTFIVFALFMSFFPFLNSAYRSLLNQFCFKRSIVPLVHIFTNFEFKNDSNDSDKNSSIIFKEKKILGNVFLEKFSSFLR